MTRTAPLGARRENAPGNDLARVAQQVVQAEDELGHKNMADARELD